MDQVSSQAAPPWLMTPPLTDLPATLAAAIATVPGTGPPGVSPAAGTAAAEVTTAAARPGTAAAGAEATREQEGVAMPGAMDKTAAAAACVPPAPLGVLEQQLVALLGQPHNYEGFPPEPEQYLSVGLDTGCLAADTAAAGAMRPGKRQTDGGAAAGSNSIGPLGPRISAGGLSGPGGAAAAAAAGAAGSAGASRRQSSGAAAPGLPEHAWQELMEATRVRQ